MVREMIEKGEGILNICVDDIKGDAKTAMTGFLTLALSYPDIAGTPIMLESAHWEVIEAGLKCLPGKGIVNFLNPAEEPGEFRRKARLIRRFGAAVLVRTGKTPMQDSPEPGKTEVALRARTLLLEEGFFPEDIIFDAVVS
jgi:5-methyltetrahydrofolate--homocysteine methyltransferase